MVDRDLNDIAVFAKVVEAQSFTGAGTLLGMPRSTVSRRIADLERRLGARLLHRTTRKLRLTDLGSRYYELCSSALSAIDDAEACVLAASERPRGKLRITAPSAMEAQLGPAIASFLRLHPDVSLEIEMTQRMVDLIADNFDLAIRATGHLPDSTMVARQLGSGNAALWASPGYLDGAPAINAPSDLIQHETVTLGSARTWTLFGSDDAPIDVPIRPRLTVNAPSLALEAALADFGVALLPFDFQESAISDRLRRVLPAYRSLRATLYLVYPSAKLMSATLRALRDHLLEHFSPWSAEWPSALGRLATDSAPR